MSKSICVLHENEATRLEHWGIWPCCKSHHHISVAKAASFIEDEKFRWVGGANTAAGEYVSAIVACPNDRGWKTVSYGKLGYKTWQMVGVGLLVE